MPPQMREKDKDRRNTWRVGLAAGAFALFSAAIAAGSSVWATHAQTTSQSEQSRDDFLRSQRQVAYGKLLADAALLQTQQSQFEGNDVGYGLDTGKPVTYADIESTLTTIASDVASIQVVGSEDAAEIATRFNIDIGSLATNIALNVACVKGADKLPGQQCDQVAHDRESLSTKLSGDVSNFVAQCRKDLDAN